MNYNRIFTVFYMILAVGLVYENIRIYALIFVAIFSLTFAILEGRKENMQKKKENEKE